ncbi:Hypothetical protein ORPV_650 [Orpheovirus IHUMI-LCC2]|uniref:Uncharacterized protein n=1 Tax=Orpheovirus IHUMI-LCC2 TaxID=2023057 RepID=A0A2I2L4U7_9VIRU|nr:Hypothetical protein ORPV_650 [Orpheovirus IHUMI-LCC2]SNW62554.1 Hypothetical protein ORPV_650 [Orpheovirus IHUMI-LCC2]
MEVIDIILHITSFIKDCKTLYNISFINKNVYNAIRTIYEKKKIIKSIIGDRYEDITHYYVSKSFVDMLQSLQHNKIRGLLTAYIYDENEQEGTGCPGFDVLTCNNVYYLLDNIHRIMDVYEDEVSECKLIIGNLEIQDDKCTNHKLLEFYLIGNKLKYYNKRKVKDYKSEDLEILWIYDDGKTYSFDFIDYVITDSDYYNNWYKNHHWPYTIDEAKKVTINDITCKYDDNDGDYSYDKVKLDGIRDKIRKYLLAGIKS